MRAVAAIAFFVLLILGCGQEKHSGKGVWDETENGVAIVVKDQQGNPIKGARVRLIPLQNWHSQVSMGESPVLDSAIASDKGEATVAGTAWPAALEVEQGNLVGRIILYRALESQSITLQHGTALSGTLQGSPQNLPAYVRIAGSTARAQVGVDGTFAFPSLPSGDLLLVGEGNQSLSALQSVNVPASEAVTLDSIPVFSSTQILLDDFADDIAANRYFYLTGNGWWYVYADSGSAVFPSNVQDAVSDGVMHVQLQPDSTRETAFSMVGFDLNGSLLSEDHSLATHDLSALDSLCFQAKGTGQIMVQITGQDSLDSADHVNATVTLGEQWQSYCLAPASFPDWDALRKRVAGIAFASQKPAELWLDQIQIFGITEQDLFFTR